MQSYGVVVAVVVVVVVVVVVSVVVVTVVSVGFSGVGSMSTFDPHALNAKIPPKNAACFTNHPVREIRMPLEDSMRTLHFLGLLFLTACGPASVSGHVDDERVGSARDAFFDVVEFDAGIFGEVNFLVVVISDIPDACEVYQDVFADAFQTCEDRCDDYTQLAEDALGKDSYWSTTLVAHSDGDFVREYDYDADLGSDEFSLGFARLDATPMYDQDTCESSCEDGELLDADNETGNSGGLEIVEYVRDESVKGNFEVDMGSEEQLKGSFKAHKCDTSSWLFL